MNSYYRKQTPPLSNKKTFIEIRNGSKTHILVGKRHSSKYRHRGRILITPRDASPYGQRTRMWLVKQAVKSQVFRNGMRWTYKNFCDAIASQHISIFTSLTYIRRNTLLLKSILVARLMGDETEILMYSVHPLFRRKGLGKSFLTTCMDYLKFFGAESMYLEVAATNRPAILMYKSCGFVITGIRKNYYTFSSRKKIDALLMWRQL